MTVILIIIALNLAALYWLYRIVSKKVTKTITVNFTPVFHETAYLWLKGYVVELLRASEEAEMTGDEIREGLKDQINKIDEEIALCRTRQILNTSR